MGNKSVIASIACIVVLWPTSWAIATYLPGAVVA